MHSRYSIQHTTFYNKNQRMGYLVERFRVYTGYTFSYVEQMKGDIERRYAKRQPGRDSTTNVGFDLVLVLERMLMKNENLATITLEKLCLHIRWKLSVYS